MRVYHMFRPSVMLVASSGVTSPLRQCPLYLTDKLHGALYDQQDLEIIQMLALHAASAIDRAQLYRRLEAAHRAAIAQRDQLLAAEQLKDDFLSLVSHEFRTPLTAIHGGARLLASDNDRIDAETRRELLDDIVTESDRLDRMLANMLSLAAMMAGRSRWKVAERRIMSRIFIPGS